MSGFIDAQEGRVLFGADVQNYDTIRPPYPAQIYDFLVAMGALRSNMATLEIGAGNGLATRRLLDFGVNPLTIIEPDSRFFPLLTSLSERYKAEVQLMAAAFEEATLPHQYYDLVVAATSFHWVQPTGGLARVAELLRPGGSVALWWNVFGDHERADPFHEATKTILQPLASSPSGAPERVPFALDTPARLRDFAQTGHFAEPAYAAYHWTFVLNTAQVGALYATFSSISRLPEEQRKLILSQLMGVAEKRFGGRVERNMVSPVYVAKRLVHTGRAVRQ